MTSSTSDPNPVWDAAQHWQAYAAEVRANLLRIIAVGSFYLIHLWNYLSSQGKLPNWGILQLAAEGELERKFHLMVTFLTLAWLMLAAGVHFSLLDRVYPRWLPWVTSLLDVLLLSSVLCISSGPRSPLVSGYFLIIAVSALRLDLTLIRVTTVAAMLGYLGILGCAKWPALFGLATDLDLRVPRYHQLVTLLALALTGIFLGQIVRRVKTIVIDAVGQLSKGQGAAS